MTLRPGALILSAMAVALGVLGGAWVLSRAARYEAPRWSEDEVVPLERPGEARAAVETWVLPVNPSCSHCSWSLERFRRRAADHDGERLVVLIVDAPREPDAPTVERLGEGVEVWWDARSIWRGRWGYRVYGEPLCFDGSGGFIRRLDLVTHAPRRRTRA